MCVYVGVCVKLRYIPFYQMSSLAFVDLIMLFSSFDILSTELINNSRAHFVVVDACFGFKIFAEGS